MSTAHDIIAGARAAGRVALPEAEGKRLLNGFGIRTPASLVVPGPDAVAGALAGRSGPFVVKVVSPDILHKSDVGGVKVDLPDAAAVADAIAAMAAIPAIAAARLDGFLVEEMIPEGVELVVGAVHDPQFGPMIMVGLGGVFVEVLKDVAFRLCPITPADAAAMLDELRGGAMLDGARGRAAVDRRSVEELLMGIGGPDGLMMRLGHEVKELDINPIIATANGNIAVDARVILFDSPLVTAINAAATDDAPILDRFAPLFAPRAVAVYGASTTSVSIANTFIRRLKSFGYAGDIYPIHPKAEELEGLRAYPDLSATPHPVDYAYIAIGARNIPKVLAEANGRLRFAQVISSGFGESEEGKELEAELVAAARTGGCRVLGPNCLGLYSPRGRITFPVGAPDEVGTVGVVTQSGGLGTDIIKRGQWRGLRFSGLVTMGNSADLTPVDLLEFYFADPQTKVIGLYIEDIKDGHAFFDALRSPRAGKPVVLLKGGRSQEGRAAAASHTGALAGDERAWDALTRQTPCVLVDTVDDFIDALLALQQLTPNPAKPTREVVLFGNGGGTSVLATDFFAGQDLRIAPFRGPVREILDALNLPPGTSLANPIDAPVRTLQEEEGRIAGRILDLVYRHADFDAVVMHLNLAAFVGRGDIDPIENLFEAAVRVQQEHPGKAHFAVALRSDGSPELDERKRTYRERALALGIPVFDELAPAARALRCLQHLETRLAAAAR